MGGNPFWTGFMERGGERAQERNLLDIQNKLERHRNFVAQLKEWISSPKLTYEAQQAALKRWEEASQADPIKYKNYDISDIMSISRERLLPGTPKTVIPEQEVPQPEQEITATLGRQTPYGPPPKTQEEVPRGGLAYPGQPPSSVYNIKQTPPPVTLPGVYGMEAPPEVSETYQRSGLLSQEEMDQREAEAYQMRMEDLYRTQRDLAAMKDKNVKVSGPAIPINDKQLRAMMARGEIPSQDLPPGDYRLQWMSDGSARITPTLSKPVHLISQPIIDSAGNISYGYIDPRDPEVGMQILPNPDGAVILPTNIQTVEQKMADGTAVKAWMLPNGKLVGWAPFNPRSIATESEQFINNRWEIIRATVGRTSTPTLTGPPTFQGTVNPSQITPPPAGTPQPTGTSTTTPQPTPPQSPTPLPIAPQPTPNRDSKSYLQSSRFDAQIEKVLGDPDLSYVAGASVPADPDRGINYSTPMLNLASKDYKPPRDPEVSQYVIAELNQKYNPRADVYPLMPQMPQSNQLKNYHQDDGVYRQTLHLLGKVHKASTVLDTMSGTFKAYLMTDFSAVKKLLGRFTMPNPFEKEAAKNARLDREATETRNENDAEARRRLKRKEMTQAQYDFAIAFNGLREHIQKMRGPLGAAGFRSLEAFISLQAQRGEVLDNPIVFRGIIQNSMKTFLSLMGPNRWMLNKFHPQFTSISKGKNPMDKFTTDWYLTAYQDEDPNDLELSAVLDGWDIKGVK